MKYKCDSDEENPRLRSVVKNVNFNSTKDVIVWKTLEFSFIKTTERDHKYMNNETVCDEKSAQRVYPLCCTEPIAQVVARLAIQRGW